MSKNKLRRNYGQLPDGRLGDFGLRVGNSMTGNANFTTPPVTGASVVTLSTSFNTAVGKAMNGTTGDTLDKNNKRAALTAALDTLAQYVELQSANDAVKLVSSGFELASMNRVRLSPGPSFINGVLNVASTKLELDLAAAANAWVYLVEYAAVGTPNVKLAAFTNPRNAVLTELAPGTLYSMRVRVMGSDNQVSEWSELVQHMAT